MHSTNPEIKHKMTAVVGNLELTQLNVSNATTDAGPMVICRTDPNIIYITPPKHAPYSPN